MLHIYSQDRGSKIESRHVMHFTNLRAKQGLICAIRKVGEEIMRKQ